MTVLGLGAADHRSDCAGPSSRLLSNDRRDELASELVRALALVEAHVCREGSPADPAATDPRALRARLRLELGGSGRSAEAVWSDLARVLATTPATSSWRFQNQLFGGREPTAVAAEVVATVANVSMYTFKAAGAQVLLEDELIRHMAAHAALGDAEGTFTPGGSIANLVGLLLARDARWPMARDHGIGPRRGAIYASAESHYSIQKAATVLGLGRSAVRSVAVDARGCMDPAALRSAMESDRRTGIEALAVVATAGTTVRGAFDPVDELADVANAHGAWLHVDGALGGSLLPSPRQRWRLQGVERADSLSWNPHKLMGVGLQSSVLLVRHRGLLARSLDQSADYLFQTHADEFDPGHRSLQCGRRNDALRLWATWRRLGDDGVAARVDRLVELAAAAAARIAAEPAFELVEPPASVNVCFRVRGVDPSVLCERLYRAGRLSIGHGLAGGTRVMRLPCVDPDLGEDGVAAVLAEIARAASVAD